MCAQGQCSDNFCPTNQTCVSPTRLDCQCIKGLILDQFGDCVDIDECSPTNDCNQNAICTNTVSSYDCSCKQNFTGDGFSCDCMVGHARKLDSEQNEVCLDIDECSLTNECHENAACTNSIGSYKCDCKETFLGNGRNCFCPEGFKKVIDSDGEKKCVDIDECVSKEWDRSFLSSDFK